MIFSLQFSETMYLSTHTVGERTLTISVRQTTEANVLPSDRGCSFPLFPLSAGKIAMYCQIPSLSPLGRQNYCSKCCCQMTGAPLSLFLPLFSLSRQASYGVQCEVKDEWEPVICVCQKVSPRNICSVSHVGNLAWYQG